MVKYLKVGADPEFFLFDQNKKEYISAHDRVPGTKANPVPLKNGGMIQADGLAVEFNIPASSSAKEFSDNLRAALSDIRNEYFAKDKHLRFAFDPVANFSTAYMKTLPEHALELGCEPDFDAYNEGKANKKPDNKLPMRTGSGHLHVGYLGKLNQVDDVTDQQHVEDCCTLAIALDTVLLPHRNLWDTDKQRSTMYGNPGCFRPKRYGMEYRTLSNAWLRHPKLWPWLFGSVKRAIEIAEDPNLYQKYCAPRIVYSETLHHVSQYMKRISDAGSLARSRELYPMQVKDAIYDGYSLGPMRSRIGQPLVV